jgi:hypothetical protein
VQCLGVLTSIGATETSRRRVILGRGTDARVDQAHHTFITPGQPDAILIGDPDRDGVPHHNGDNMTVIENKHATFVRDAVDAEIRVTYVAEPPYLAAIAISGVDQLSAQNLSKIASACQGPTPAT